MNVNGQMSVQDGQTSFDSASAKVSVDILSSNKTEREVSLLKSQRAVLEAERNLTSKAVEKEKTFGSFTLPFDFYLQDYNLVIEFDGGQHKSCDNFFSRKKAEKKGVTPEEILKEQIERDKEKDEFCKQNGIRIIRIFNIKDINDILCKELAVENKANLKEIINSKLGSKRFSFGGLAKHRTKPIVCVETGEVFNYFKEAGLLQNYDNSVGNPEKTMHGFHWRWFLPEDNDPEVLKRNNEEFLKKRKYKLLCVETGEKFYSIKEAALKYFKDKKPSNVVSNISAVYKREEGKNRIYGLHWRAL